MRKFYHNNMQPVNQYGLHRQHGVIRSCRIYSGTKFVLLFVPGCETRGSVVCEWSFAESHTHFNMHAKVNTSPDCVCYIQLSQIMERRPKYVDLASPYRSKVTYLFDPGSARRELPLRDGWFPHSDFRSKREHSDGRSLG